MRKATVSPTPPPLMGRSAFSLSSLGLSFDPYDHTPLPTRILATGAAANFPSVANLVGDIFNAPVFVPLTQIDSAQVVPHRNAPVQGYPSRAALGGAYVARWVWSREWGANGLGVFEDEMKRLLGKRWIATGGALLRSNVNGATSVGAVGLVGGGGAAAASGGGSGANSGTSTPYGHPGSRSALGNTVFVEEDEDEELERERNGRLGLGLGGHGMSLNHPGVIGGGGAIGGIYGAGFGDAGQHSRMRTQTGSTADTFSSSASVGGIAPSTAYTTPDMGLGSLGVMPPGLSGGVPSASSSNGNTGAVTPTTPTPLTPVVALATGDAEAQVGLAKVAEPDLDAFMTYAAIVPEYSRLETMVLKGIV